MVSIVCPRACVGCGNSNINALERYHETITGSHTERYGTMKRTTKYSLEVTPYLCDVCKTEGKSELLRRGAKKIIFGFIILCGLIIYPVITAHWWVFELVGASNLWVAILVYLLGVPLTLLFMYDDIESAYNSPYSYYFDARLKTSARGATLRVVMKSKEYTEIFKHLNPSADAVYKA